MHNRTPATGRRPPGPTVLGALLEHAFRAGDELRGVNVENLGQAEEAREARIALAPLDAPYVGPMEACAAGELFLRDTLALA
jgi:hypothetical protein